MQIETLSATERCEKRQLLVENKIQFGGPDSVLSIYDTYQTASRVGLAADQLLFCGMISGKKVMHTAQGQPGQVFLPHESYVMPPGQRVEIDFPDAQDDTPTTCLTIEIAKERVAQIAEKMRDITVLEQLNYDWQYQPRIMHSHHNQETQLLLEKMVHLYTQNDPDKEIRLDLGVSELVIKLLREQGRELLLHYSQQLPDLNGMTAALQYLETHLSLPLDMDQLCKLACMSRSRLYVEFKKQVGCTPYEFQQQIRLKAAAEALRSGKTVTETCYSYGFNDLSHFSRRFSGFFGCTPSQYRLKSES